MVVTVCGRYTMPPSPSTNVKRILSFDIGIKNLAWCCLERAIGVPSVVVGWANENLLTDSTAEETIAAGKCASCSHKASYWVREGSGYCVRHCPLTHPPLRDGEGVLLKKIPTLPVLKVLAQKIGAEKQHLKSKTTLLDFVSTKRALPLTPAPIRTKAIDLESLHTGICSMISRNIDVFRSADCILLENQPAFKNPVMKSVQMMLFASLRILLGPNPPSVKLVHAGKKTKGTSAKEAKGDEGYSDRKEAGEARVQSVLQAGSVVFSPRVHNGNTAWFSLQKKKSDLADAMCMCLDYTL